MVTNKDITVIIPVHKWNEDIKNMMAEAIKSIPTDANLIISTVNGSGVEVTNEIADSFASFAIVFNLPENGTNFQALVNNGVKNVKTEWFSILEFDDEYSPIWFNNFAKYQEYNQQYNMFLPLNDLYNQEGEKEEFAGNGNEAPWASSFSDEIGVIDEKAVEDYFDFYLDGGIFKKAMWDEVGGLKESLKLTFWYEFLLRATHKGEKIYVVPKVGYSHVLGRADSLMMQCRETIDEKESEFWFKTAKIESYHTTDRKPVYVPKEDKADDGNEE